MKPIEEKEKLKSHLDSLENDKLKSNENANSRTTLKPNSKTDITHGPEISLILKEANPKDVGRGIVRIDPKDMEKIGADVGDIVEITGKRTSAVKLMPAYVENRGKKSVFADGVIRENIQCSIDDKVKIKVAENKPASSVILKPLFKSSLYLPKDSRYVVKLFEGIPLIEGDRLRTNLIGSLGRDFEVVSTIPKGIVIIHPDTKITIQSEEAKVPVMARQKVAYEDIGGLHKEIQRIREMIELPLKHSRIFEVLGIEPPKGVLLHGPPGTGKTLIARAVASETDAHFIKINGPEVIHKFYGESEAKLRGIFEEASKHAPCIIFLDEIDAIAPKRAEVTGEVEKRVVAQLLALMDGLESRGQVIVIGATNIPNNLDPALRRPGRFDRELTIGVPDKEGRLEILQIHTRGMPLDETVDLKQIAGFTHGYVGADLEALCREAAMNEIRKVLPQINWQLEEIPDEILMDLKVTMEDFRQALNEIEPSSLRDVIVEVPDVTWDEVGGLEEVKKTLRESVEWPLKYPSLFDYTKAKPAKGILLYGPPGTGKTLIGKAVANASEANFIYVKGPTFFSKWVGESEKAVREIFKKARQATPTIIFFDEIDGIASSRGSTGDSGVGERVMSQLLTELDGIEELKGVIVIGATNRPDILDPALLRPGRFDFKLELPLPDPDSRKVILKIHTKEKPLDFSVDISKLAKKLDGWSGADLSSLCNKAALCAIRDYLNSKPNDLKQLTKINFKITQKHFDEAISQITSSTMVDTHITTGEKLI